MRDFNAICAVLAFVGLLATVLLFINGISEAQVRIIEYTVPTPNSGPNVITPGPDGNLWFTEVNSNKIGRITTSGVVTEYPVPTPEALPEGITAGPDGNLWFVEFGGNKIGRITVSGEVTEFAIPTFGSGAMSITAGPDGNLWFTEAGSYNIISTRIITSPGQIGRITLSGAITEFPVFNPSPSSGGGTSAGLGPNTITVGPDGNLWYTISAGDIGRITPAGVFTQFNALASLPKAITAGPDGNLWFTGGSFWVIRVTTDGAITQFHTKDSRALPLGITTGPDGALWYLESGEHSKIGRITTSGIVTEYVIPSRNSEPWWITVGPDGNLWFTDISGNKIDKVVLSTDSVPPGAPHHRPYH